MDQHRLSNIALYGRVEGTYIEKVSNYSNFYTAPKCQPPQLDMLQLSKAWSQAANMPRDSSDYWVTVMKIRWFASQNATHFRSFANQFNNLAHSGANHLVRGNVIVIRYKHPAVSSQTLAGFMSVAHWPLLAFFYGVYLLKLQYRWHSLNKHGKTKHQCKNRERLDKWYGRNEELDWDRSGRSSWTRWLSKCHRN